MASVNVISRLTIKNISKKEDLIDVFKELSHIDADFCGNNGTQYNWEETKHYNFMTNANFLADLVINKINSNNITDYTEMFTSEWLKRDNYYRSINILTEKMESKENQNSLKGIYAFCIVATTNY